MSPPRPDGSVPSQILPSDVVRQLLVTSFVFFMSRLLDPAGQPLDVAAHQRRWCRLVAESKRLVLLAPRDHGKTTLMLAFLLWQCYRHAHDEFGRPRSKPTGVFSAVLFSATKAQASVLLEKFRDLLAANPGLMGALGPASLPEPGPSTRRWSQTDVALASGARVSIRAYRTSTRGLHPDVLVLDDVLSDQNSGTSDQRAKTWHYFVSTLLPMHPGKLVVVGTALHQDDLLHRLRPAKPALGQASTTPEFSWVKYRALDEERQISLWPERHPYHELLEHRALDPTIFSREYMNDPRDDVASYFPHALTQPAFEAGAAFGFESHYRPLPWEYVVMGVDLAISDQPGADYTVALVVAVDRRTGRRRLLTARRLKGVEMMALVELFADLFPRFGISLAMVEENGFQEWLLPELRKRPEIRGFVYGHRTGRNKTDLEHGIPRLRYELEAGMWIFPGGDAASREFGATLRAEFGAFGWHDGRLEGKGEHDDTVMALWLAVRAIAYAEELLGRPPAVEIVTPADLGLDIPPVRIGNWDDDDRLEAQQRRLDRRDGW
jgi:hypothetical protein